MIRTKDQSEIKEGMLTAQETQLFIKEIEEKCLKVDFIGLIETLNKYPLKNINQEDYNDFISQASKEL
jgi:tagatose-1,6-bisphosphate aldolase